MHLMRIGPPGAERPAVRAGNDAYIDVGDLVGDFDGSFFARGGADLLRDAVTERAAAGATTALAGQRIGAPIARPQQILCIGLNYRDHAVEAGMPISDEPIVFNKAPNTLVGPNDDVHIPRGSTKTDWEVELGVVIGRTCRDVSVDDALDYVFGYVTANDLSARDLQFAKDGGIIVGKNFDTSAPMGTFVALTDELPDPNNLRLRTWVNGQLRQDGNTQTLIFDVPAIIAYLSRQLTLEPGDVIATGTPAGVGLGMKPQVWLQPGDTIRMEIDGLGTLENSVVDQ